MEDLEGKEENTSKEQHTANVKLWKFLEKHEVEEGGMRKQALHGKVMIRKAEALMEYDYYSTPRTTPGLLVI